MFKFIRGCPLVCLSRQQASVKVLVVYPYLAVKKWLLEITATPGPSEIMLIFYEPPKHTITEPVGKLEDFRTKYNTQPIELLDFIEAAH